MNPSRSRSMWIATASVVATAALSGCSGGTTPSGPTGEDGIALAGVVANSTDPFWITVMCGATKAAKAADATIDWYTSPTTSAESMSQNFNSALLTDPDGLYLNPFQAAQFSTQVADLMADGVPVVTSTPLDPTTEYTDIPLATEGSGYVDEFLEILSDGPGALAVLGGIPGIPVVDASWQPLTEAVADARPDITVLPTEYTDFDVTKSTQIVSALLLAHPDLKMIVAISGPEGAGAAAAVQQAGLAGKVQIWALDAVPAEVEALEAGVITVLAAKPAQLMGQRSVEVLLEQIAANPDRKPIEHIGSAFEPLPLTLITKENIDSPEAQAAIYKDTCD